MIPLDVLDYLSALDEELEKRGVERTYRTKARREIRRVLEDLAFRSALFEGRPNPDDLDYERALEALKPPPDAATLLLSRLPEYRRRVRNERVVRGGGVVLLVVVGALFFLLVTSEVGTTLLSVQEGSFSPVTRSYLYTFSVTEDLTRVRLDCEVHGLDPRGSVVVTLLDPSGKEVWRARWTTSTSPALFRNVEPPELVGGEWSVVVDVHETPYLISLRVQGVRPAR